MFPVAGLPPPRTVDSPGPTFSSGQGQISAWQPGGLSWALGAPCPAALPSSIERRGLLPGPSQWSDHSGPLPAPPHPPPGWSSASTASHLQGGLCFSHAGTLLLPASGRPGPPSQHSPSLGQGLLRPPPLTCAISPWLSQERLCPTSWRHHQSCPSLGLSPLGPATCPPAISPAHGTPSSSHLSR